MVFCRFAGAPPSTSEICQAAQKWAMENIDSPMRELVWAYINPDLMALQVALRRDIPVEILRECAPMLSEEQRREIDAATHCIVVRASDHLPGPRLGLWAAVAVSKACAERYGSGVMLDADTSGPFPVKTPFRELHSKFEPRLTRFVRSVYSFSASGAGYMTTSGMPRFGLPDLQVIDIPMIDMEALGATLIGLCQVLVTMVGGSNGDHETPEPIPGVLETVVTDAYLRTARLPNAPPVKTGAEARVRLEYGPRPGHPEQKYFTLRPPGGYTGEYGAWLHSLVNTFFEPENTVRPTVVAAPGVETMDQAHSRALAELPTIKRRYLSGAFVPGQFLIKHGFPVGGGRNDEQEFMWLVVREWMENRIVGELVNKPQLCKNIKMGQVIELTEADIFDWIVIGPDGPEEGGYTNSAVDLDESGALDLTMRYMDGSVEQELPPYVVRRSEPTFRQNVEREGRAEVRHEYEEYIRERAGLRLTCFKKTAPGWIIGAVIWKWVPIIALVALAYGIWEGWRAIRILRKDTLLKRSYQDVSEAGEFAIAIPFIFESTHNPISGTVDFPNIFILLPDDDLDPDVLYNEIAERLSNPVTGANDEASVRSAILRRIQSKKAVLGRRTRVPESWVGGRTIYVVDMTITSAFVKERALQGVYVPCLATPGDNGSIATLSMNVVVNALKA